MNLKFQQLNNVYKNFCNIVIMPTCNWYKMRHTFSHEHNIEYNRPNDIAKSRASLSILGALGKLSSSGPPRAIHGKAFVHYSTICKQHINTRLCMHANTVLTLFVKSIVSYCYLSILLFLQVIPCAII